MKKKIKPEEPIFKPGTKCINCGAIIIEPDNFYMCDAQYEYDEDGCVGSDDHNPSDCIKHLRKRLDSIKLISR